MRAFLAGEAAGGIVLIAAAALALIVANSPLAPTYFAALHISLGALSLLHWINDGLMALFFLLVGLEIKREFVGGHLSRWSDRALPMVAAAGGMAVPAFVYLAMTRGVPGLSRGWAIPSATDIAFAIGVLALLGRRAPSSLRLFLTSVAIVDDMGAVLIIAVAYTAAISAPALLAAGAILAAMVTLNRAGVRALWPYLALAAALWIAVHASGVHATIAGVLAALTVPVAPDQVRSPLHRLERRLHPWVAFGVVPLFGFANAGVSLAGVGPAAILAPLPLGVAAGLFAGKQVGVVGGVWLAVRCRLAGLPAGARWLQVYGVALLCGIGFTMSLFIGGLAFPDAARADAVKLGVLLGSIASALAGMTVLRLAHGPAYPVVRAA
jgi:NhaA family Na+:H+ antiporter